jgi:putative methionine-R-sulfoxide reductase with GAF domain
MGNYTFDSTDPSINTKALEASSWSGAVSKVLGLFKTKDSLIHVDVDPSGNADIWDEDTDVHVSFDADPDSGFELWDVPTTDLWDAPNPGSGAANVKAANASDREKVHRKLDDIAKAETDMQACQIALDVLMQLVPAESGSILLAEGPQLRFIAVRGPKSEALSGATISIDQGVAGACAQTGKALLVRQARNNPQHDSTIDASVDYLTRTLLALPITNGSQVLGVVELLNPFGADTFTPDQQRLAQDVSSRLSARLSPPTKTA